MANEHTWALVLAAGDGRRLQGLTRSVHGTIVPKQYCSVFGGPSLLEEALLRARATAPVERICTVVAEQHERWWTDQAGSLPPENVITQPRNRGTANGVLLPLLKILQRDPEARLLLLPSDHYVEDELTLARWLRAAVETNRGCQSPAILLLGFEPHAADPDLGYIVPRRAMGARHWAVGAFVEKPPPGRARDLVQQGALWNAFILAADGTALLRLYERASPGLVARMQAALEAQTTGALHALYEELPNLDFSRDLLAPAVEPLHVLAVPQVGWSDLGTPQRLKQVLLGARQVTSTPEATPRRRLSLAAQYVLGVGSAAHEDEVPEALAG